MVRKQKLDDGRVKGAGIVATDRVMTKAEQKKQGGFTLVEMIVALIVMGVLTGLMVFAYGSHAENARVGLVDQFFLEAGPAGIAAYRLRTGGLTGLAKTNITDVGAEPDTPWGDIWTMSLSGQTVTFVYPLDTSKDPDVLGPQLTGKYGAFNHITSATYDAGSDDMTIAILL